MVKIPPQIRRAEAPSDSPMAKPIKAGAGHLAWQKHENQEHHDKFDADQQHADGHAGGQGDVEKFARFAFQRGEGHSAVGQGVHADAEPGHAVGAQDTHDGGAQDNGDPRWGISEDTPK